jgi:hypothetical protein
LLKFQQPAEPCVPALLLLAFPRCRDNVQPCKTRRKTSNKTCRKTGNKTGRKTGNKTYRKKGNKAGITEKFHQQLNMYISDKEQKSTTISRNIYAVRCEGFSRAHAQRQ